jgi:predicted transcriptional regulator
MAESFMKRTTVTLPRDLVNDLMEVAPAKNKTQAVIAAVHEFVKRRKVETLKRFAGHGRWPKKGNA